MSKDMEHKSYVVENGKTVLVEYSDSREVNDTIVEPPGYRDPSLDRTNDGLDRDYPSTGVM